MNRRYSHTSNNVKLYKHLDKLRMLQNGKIVPIVIHVSPTNICQENCNFCCFRNRKKALEMPFEVLKQGVSEFYGLGSRAIEITGGGEPTLYTKINEMIRWLSYLGMHIGMNTNAVESQNVDCWEMLDWVRVSLNMLDYHDDINIGPIRKVGAYISGCYIWNDFSTPETLERVVQFADREKIACRIAPDCIVKIDKIDETINVVKEVMKDLTKSEYVFLSDFNVDTYRHNQKCYIHLIKPFFFTDGNVYPCPSTELAIENDAQVLPKFKVCGYDEIVDFYTSGKAFEIEELSCSYCKYAKQQIVLEDVLTETIFNEFA